MFKVIAILAFVAVANAGVAYVDHRIDDLGTVGAQSEQTVRGLGFGGLSTVSHQTKAVDSAYSSVRKHDTRVINPAVYAQPAYAHVAAPVAAPVAYAAPAYAHQAYAAPAYAHQAYAAPAYAHHGYAAPVVAKAAPVVAAAPAVYSAAPAYRAAVAAPVAAYAASVPAASTTGNLLGVRYSSFPQAASYHFDSPVLGHFAY